MRKSGCLRAIAVWLAVAGMCAPQAAIAAPPRAANPVIVDVALGDDGLLLGQLIRHDGAPLVSAPVWLRSGAQDLASNTTNAGGYFGFSRLRTGTYQVVTRSAVGTYHVAAYQVWARDIAPPSARPTATIVVDDATVRGQYTPRQYAGLIGPPLVICGLIAAAIAVPIAVSQSQRSSASGE